MGQALPPNILLMHYLDDFLLVHHDKEDLRRHTGGAVIALERGGFIVGPKSVLEPSTRTVFLGKWLDLLERRVWSHKVAHLQMLVAWIRLAVRRSQKRRLMQSFLGFLHWQVRPRGLACPFAVGASCWLNGDQGGYTPVAVLESPVVLQVMAAEPWCARAADVQTQCLKLGLHRYEQALLGCWWEGPRLVLFVDGAHDGPFRRMGGFSEFLGVRSALAMSLRSQSQQLSGLQLLA